MKQLKTMAGCLCLCLAAGCTSPASQQENVAVTEGMTQSDAVIKTIMERRSVYVNTNHSRLIVIQCRLF